LRGVSRSSRWRYDFPNKWPKDRLSPISSRTSAGSALLVDMKLEVLSLVLRLDCLSCFLTVFSTILVGRRCWEGWVLAAANSLIICVNLRHRVKNGAAGLLMCPSRRRSPLDSSDGTSPTNKATHCCPSCWWKRLRSRSARTPTGAASFST
jgi:hypothetical protein